MKMRWVIVFLPVVSVIAISIAVHQHANRVAAAEPATPIASQAQAAAPAAEPSNGGPLSIPDTTLAINSATPMSQRVVHYEIDAHYDAVNHIVNATEVLTYHNLTGQALDHFPFHLYQNAFQPNSTWVREAKVLGNRDIGYDKWESKEFGSEEIKQPRSGRAGRSDFAAAVHPARRWQQRRQDRRGRAVDQADRARRLRQFKIAFQTKFPETQARSGWKRDFVLGGQWFPKVGVWWHGAWNCHQYHAMTEFFADFGVYDVKLTRAAV